MAYAYNVQQIDKGNLDFDDAYKWFESKHSYTRMVFSFKPLTLEAWFTQEEIEKIKS